MASDTSKVAVEAALVRRGGSAAVQLPQLLSELANDQVLVDALTAAEAATPIEESILLGLWQLLRDGSTKLEKLSAYVGYSAAT